MGSHGVTYHPTELTFRPLPQPKLVLDLAIPEGCKAELTYIVGWLHTEMVATRPKTVTHPCANRARRALASFMRRTPLTTTPRSQPTQQLSKSTYCSQIDGQTNNCVVRCPSQSIGPAFTRPSCRAATAVIDRSDARPTSAANSPAGAAAVHCRDGRTFDRFMTPIAYNVDLIISLWGGLLTIARLHRACEFLTPSDPAAHYTLAR